MTKKPLIIFGAGGLGREVKTLVDVLPEWHLEGFCDDHLSAGTLVDGLPVLGDFQYLPGKQNFFVVVAIGNPFVKIRIVQQLEMLVGIQFATLIHPRAVLGNHQAITIGEGSIITAGCVLTTAISIGRHVLVNLNSTIGHDASIGHCSSIMPGVNIAGNVRIDERVLIGSGANILNGVHIADGAIIGSGAVVRTNVSEGATAVGVPAREIR